MHVLWKTGGGGGTPLLLAADLRGTPEAVPWDYCAPGVGNFLQSGGLWAWRGGGLAFPRLRSETWGTHIRG